VDLDRLRTELAGVATTRIEGRVQSVTGLALTATLLGARIGDVISVGRRGSPLLAEVVGFRGGEVLAMPLGDLTGVGPDDPVVSTSGPLDVVVGEDLLGRVLDGLGRPLDGKVAPAGTRLPVDRTPPPPLSRNEVSAPLPTGIRAIDSLLTLGVGQRIGLFSGSGVGKSTLLGSLARGARADVVVVALVGERGREVREFVEHTLAPARDRTVTVVATSDAPPLERFRATQVATTVAEFFRDRGASVLLLVDSITRVARAQREVGLAAGEPPARRGYPPSVFAVLPRLLERSGQSERGSITAIYTVLVEGDDLDEPVTDEVRAILDGHIVLSRALAATGHYPAIDVGASVSRVMPRVTTGEHRNAAQIVRELSSIYEEKRDLLALGAYREGNDVNVDRAMRAQTDIQRFLRQTSDDISDFATTLEGLRRIATRHG